MLRYPRSTGRKWSSASSGSEPAPPEHARDDLIDAGLEIIPFSVADAELTAAWREPTRALGLSLADRACLALAHRAGRPALTADRSWSDLDLGVDVTLIR